MIDHIKQGIELGAIAVGGGASILLAIGILIEIIEDRLGREGATIITIIAILWILGFTIGAFK